MQTISTSGLSALSANAALQIDTDSDGTISPAEVQSYAKIVNNYVDVNLDGVVNSNDVTMITNALTMLTAFGLNTPPLGAVPLPGLVAPAGVDSDFDSFL